MRFIFITFLTVLYSVSSVAQFYLHEDVLAMKKALSFKEVTPDMVLDHFDKHGMKDVHPRLFAGSDDIERIKRLISEGDTLMLLAWDAMKKEADDNMAKPFPPGDLDAANLRVYGVHRTAVMVPPLVIAYWISGDAAYAERAWLAFENMAGFPDWGVQTIPPYNDRHFLDTGIAAFVVALIYDGLYHYLTEKQKQILVEAVQKFVFNPAMAQYDGSAQRTWQWNMTNHNWNGICNGGVITASLMLMESNPEQLSKLVAMALADLPLYLREFEPHGQSEEGLMYWHYGLMYTLPAVEAMQRTLGTDFGYSDTPGLRRAGYFPIYTSGPVVTLSVGDDPLKGTRINSFFWFSKRFQDAALARMTYDLAVENGGQLKWYNMFFYDPELVRRGVALKPDLDSYVYGLELVSMRSDWDDPRSLFVTVHGGGNDVNHGHLDAGTFYLQALGEIWAEGNLGRDDYTFPGYFVNNTKPAYHDKPAPQTEPGRWHFYRLRAEGKNCLVFNPDTRPDQYERGHAWFKDHRFGGVNSSVTVDLTHCYSRDVSSYERTITMDREESVVVIEDMFEVIHPSTVWWSMHARADIHISDDGTSVRLTQNGKNLFLTLESAQECRFVALPATYLPGQSFPLTTNSPNDPFSKLSVRFDADGAAFIRVRAGLKDIR